MKKLLPIAALLFLFSCNDQPTEQTGEEQTLGASDTVLPRNMSHLYRNLYKGKIKSITTKKYIRGLSKDDQGNIIVEDTSKYEISKTYYDEQGYTSAVHDMTHYDSSSPFGNRTVPHHITTYSYDKHDDYTYSKKTAIEYLLDKDYQIAYGHAHFLDDYTITDTLIIPKFNSKETPSGKLPLSL